MVSILASLFGNLIDKSCISFKSLKSFTASTSLADRVYPSLQSISFTDIVCNLLGSIILLILIVLKSTFSYFPVLGLYLYTV